MTAEATSPPAVAGGMFSSLRIRNYRLYFIGQGISVAGNWMQNVAIAWLVLSLTGSAVVLGVVTAARFVPLVLLGPWGGLIADRSDKRRLLTATQVAMGLLALLLAILSLGHHASLGALLAIVVALGLVNVLDGPVRQSIIGNLVARDEIANAVTLNSVVMNASRIIGPSIGGALIATLGIAPCFFVNALSFGAVIVSLAAMRGSELYPSSEDPLDRPDPGRPALRRAYPGRARPADHGAGGRHLRLGVPGQPAAGHGADLPRRRGRLRRRDVLPRRGLDRGRAVGGAAAPVRRTGAGLVGCALGGDHRAAAVAPTMIVFYVMIATVGAGAIAFNSAAKTLLQLTAEPVMRGRVMALWSIAWQGSAVIGAPIVGVVADAFGARYGLGIGGICCVAVAVPVLLTRHRGLPG